MGKEGHQRSECQGGGPKNGNFNNTNSAPVNMQPSVRSPQLSLLGESGLHFHQRYDQVVVAVGVEEVERMSALKTVQVVSAADEVKWRQEIRAQMETELERRVREALATPPRERMRRRQQLTQQKITSGVDYNNHLLVDLSAKDRLKTRHWRVLPGDSKDHVMSFFPRRNSQLQFLFRDELSKSNQDEFPGVFGLENLSEGIKNIRDDFTQVVNRIGAKPKARHFYTKEGFLKAMRSGQLPAGVQLLDEEKGVYADKHGVVRNSDGPFWPMEIVPLFDTPRFKIGRGVAAEPLYVHLPDVSRTVDNQCTPYNGRWKGTVIVYDSERSPREFSPLQVGEGVCPTLGFESRFESGNLRQARRIGMYDYELVLQTDLYTRRHTQWFFFRVHNAQPGVTYRFRIVNLLKPDSLYNYGMRPLLYSEKEAEKAHMSWVRTGHHISYTKNITHLTCPLLSRCTHHYMLEWQMEFPHDNDVCYLAQCYPYTFTDLKNDLEELMDCPERKACIHKEVLCQSRAGNSCFLLTVTNFEKEGPKKAVVLTARVHPGETQASWVMRGLLQFLTSADPVAQELRDKMVFKLVPMLNPDGVIVGNYRCSLAAKDLNRNYRHPRRDNFPTIHCVKAMVQQLAQQHEILVYCDLHGHSRRHNVFMYGNNTSSGGESTGVGAARSFVSERLFPWLMAAMCPDKFSFKACKFHIQRCKESTGRVVMWKQMNIFNSFTLEATFSGSILSPTNYRHFNVHDLMDVGKALAKTILEYQHVQEDELKQTEIVLEMTQAIAHQILQTRGGVSRNNITSGQQQPATSVPRSHIETRLERVKGDAQQWTKNMLNLLQEEVTSDPEVNPADTTGDLETSEGQGQVQGRQEVKAGRRPTIPALAECVGEGEAETATGILDQPRVSAMDGCFSVLAALNVREAFDDSDSSSDSDSESEPEIQPPDRKPRRKKKRKSRKQRDREHNQRKASLAEKKAEEKEKEARQKIISATAGSLAVPERQAGKERRTMVTFQSKFLGRHNGGLPCFTEERSMERAAKKVTDVRKKFDDDKFREVSMMSFEELGGYIPPYPSHLFPQAVMTEEEMAIRVPHPPHEEGGPARAVVGGLVRTGYTHAVSDQAVNDLHLVLNDQYLRTQLSSALTSNPSARRADDTYHHGNDKSNFNPMNTDDVPASGKILPPIDDKTENRSGQGQTRRLQRRHSSPGDSGKSVRREHARPHDNHVPARVVKKSTQVAALVTDRTPHEKFYPGRAPLVRGLRHPQPPQTFKWK